MSGARPKAILQWYLPGRPFLLANRPGSTLDETGKGLRCLYERAILPNGLDKGVHQGKRPAAVVLISALLVLSSAAALGEASPAFATAEPAYCQTVKGTWDGVSTCTLSGTYLLNSGTLEITPGTTLRITYALSIYGLAIESGASLVVDRGGTLEVENSGGSHGIVNGGAVVNLGNITIAIQGSITNGILDEAGSKFNNSGMITIRAGGSTLGWLMESPSIVTNAGTINVESGYGIDNQDKLTNECSGTIVVASTGTFTNEGTITNSGTITGTIENTGSGAVNPGPGCTSTSTSTSTTSSTSSSQTSTLSSSSSSTTSSGVTLSSASGETSSSSISGSNTSGGGGIPEFPFQAFLIPVFTLVTLVSYLFVRGRSRR